MTNEEKLRARLNRMERWVDRAVRAWQKTVSEADDLYVQAVRDLEDARATTQAELKIKEEQLAGELESWGKEFARNKYILERDKTKTKTDLTEKQAEIQETRQQMSAELERIKQEQLNNQISFERQKSALNDLYQEKKRHLLVTREKMIRESAQAHTNLSTYKEKYERELSAVRADYDKRITFLKDQLASKREGWALALETIKRELDALTRQKNDVEDQLSTIHSEKEKEIDAAKMQMTIAREQLELDKASLIEKAEEEQRVCEADIKVLQEQSHRAEVELQNLILAKETEKKNLEDASQNEETLLKEAVKNEAEKRDYEHRLYAQEKAIKEKELLKVKEEYEKKKWHWDNQLRTLMMQKSVQDAEHEADRLRTDRSAREVLRSLAAKRDELSRRVSDLKSKHDTLVANANKETELLSQRWRWRKERIWTMWQTRLDVLKQERGVIGEQLQKLENDFHAEKARLLNDEKQQDKKVEDLRQYSLHVMDRLQGNDKTREIQFELEKARLIAQIKECEILVSDWMDRQKLTQAEVSKKTVGMLDQMDFLDKFYKSEQHESEMFLHVFRKTLATLQGELERVEAKQDAA
jgi:hypothetical protein